MKKGREMIKLETWVDEKFGHMKNDVGGRFLKDGDLRLKTEGRRVFLALYNEKNSGCVNVEELGEIPPELLEVKYGTHTFLTGRKEVAEEIDLLNKEISELNKKISCLKDRMYELKKGDDSI